MDGVILFLGPSALVLGIAGLLWISAGTQTPVVRWLFKAAAVLPFAMLGLYAAIAVLLVWTLTPHGETKVTIDNRTTGAVALIEGEEGEYRIVVPPCGQVVLGGFDLRSFRVGPSATPADDALAIRYSIPYPPDAPLVATLVITSSGLRVAYPGDPWTPPPCVGTPAPIAVYEPGRRSPVPGATADLAHAWTNPMVWIKPSTSLKDGQSVMVTVSGFGIGSHVFLSECSSDAVVSTSGCGLDLLSQPSVTTDASRGGSLTFTVRAVAADRPGASAAERCTDQCVLVASLGPGYGFAWTPMRFAAAPSP